MIKKGETSMIPTNKNSLTIINPNESIKQTIKGTVEDTPDGPSEE